MKILLSFSFRLKCVCANLVHHGNYHTQFLMQSKTNGLQQNFK